MPLYNSSIHSFSFFPFEPQTVNDCHKDSILASVIHATISNREKVQMIHRSHTRAAVLLAQCSLTQRGTNQVQHKLNPIVVHQNVPQHLAEWTLTPNP